MGEPVLQVRDVSNSVLKDVNLEVEKGDFFVILAPSGSGKSNLLRVICGMQPVASGQIVIDGVDIYTIPNLNKWRAANIGYIYEENNLVSTLTVYENVELPLVATKTEKRKRRARVLKALESVGLMEKEGMYSRKLSMYEEQRVALARAIATEPSIILADEPTGKLKKDQTESFIALMAELNKKTGNTLVVATHDHAFKGAATKVLELSR